MRKIYDLNHTFFPLEVYIGHKYREEMTEKPNPSTYNATKPTMHTFPMQVNLLDKLDSYIDMAHLNKLEADWSYHFAMFLLKGSEEQLSFRADFSLHAQFNRYYFAQQSALLQQGRGNFALGFPMVFVELEEEVVVQQVLLNSLHQCLRCHHQQEQQRRGVWSSPGH